MTSDAQPEGWPVWSPDGARIVFGGSSPGLEGRPETARLVQTLLDGTGANETLLEAIDTPSQPSGPRQCVLGPTDWSADGRFVLYTLTGSFPADRWLWMWLTSLVDRLEIGPCHREARDRSRLALAGLPLVLDLEGSPSQRTTDRPARGPSIDSDQQVLAALRSPWHNAYAEPQIGSIRRERLDHVIVANERGLRRLLRAYVENYLRSPTHLSLDKDAPVSRPVASDTDGESVAIPQVGGLDHRYERCTA